MPTSQNDERKSRRGMLKTGASAAAATLAATSTAAAQSTPRKVVHRAKPEKTPLFNGCISFGNLVFVAGKGAHVPGDIKLHTDIVLKEIEKELVKAGSSMDKVLKCNVYLNDLKDYKGMNEVFQGRFGDEPPVRTTIAAAGGIPGDSLVEIDVIA
ncbi:MAG: RidA family protein, partial [Acidobacteriota bacterium]